MPVQLVYRKAHTRRLQSGDVVHVAASWILRELGDRTQYKSRHEHNCPACGAKVRSVKMPNGGWVHYEVAGGLHSVKHPCFYLGDGIARQKDSETLDLFDDLVTDH